MSKSGQGTLLKNIRDGKRPKLDPRNRLILPALDAIQALRPVWIVFENVTEMRNTVIEDASGQFRPILEIIRSTLGPDYEGAAYDVEFADYGIPQRRQRLITVFTRDPHARSLFQQGVPLIPVPSHSRLPRAGLKPWISVAEALSDFEPLDAGSAESARSATNELHRVPVLDRKKYEWIRNTPPGRSAFDNQCVNPACGYQGNQTHGTAVNSGINQARKDTPLLCEKCGELLPRPYTENESGERRIMSGYTSAYKRMDATLPAPALTRNLSYPCSDNKVHPFENRVLSLWEAMHLQTIAQYEYKWGPVKTRRTGGRLGTAQAKDSLIRLVVGESVPPLFLELLGRHLIRLSFEKPAVSDMLRNAMDPQLRLGFV
jgi:DNA (cytosine-5)-methyltransferase 1